MRQIKLWNLVNDENDMPKLNVLNQIDYEPDGPEILRPYDTILLLCKLSKLHTSHVENVYIATYDHFDELIGFLHIASGDVKQVQASDRVKATSILLSGGFSFEVFHNHTIDDLTPSEEDKNSILFEKVLSGYLEAEYLGDYVITKGGWACVNTEEEHRFSKSELDFINS